MQPNQTQSLEMQPSSVTTPGEVQVKTKTRQKEFPHKNTLQKNKIQRSLFKNCVKKSKRLWGVGREMNSLQ